VPRRVVRVPLVLPVASTRRVCVPIKGHRSFPRARTCSALLPARARPPSYTIGAVADKCPHPPTQSSSRPTTLDSPLGSPRTLAVGFCSIVAAVSPEFEPQCPLPPCAFDPVHQSIPDQNFSHPSNLCELNFMLVPFVCLDGPHITTGEFPVAVKGLDVRESCLEGTFVKNKIFPGTQCN
jgi:hypothetical protein